MNNCERITLTSGDWVKLSDIPNEQVFNLVKGCFINAGFNDYNGKYARYSASDRSMYSALLITPRLVHCYAHTDSSECLRQLSLSDVFNSVNGGFDWQGCDYMHFFKDGYISYSNGAVLYPLIDTHPIKRLPDTPEAIIPPKTSQWWDYENGCAVGLPPVDTECEYSLSNGRTWFKCKVISQDKLVLDCPHVEDENGNGLQIVNKNAVMFRPLDYKSPKEIAVNKALKLVEFGSTYKDYTERLYEAGLLRNPE